MCFLGDGQLMSMGKWREGGREGDTWTCAEKGGKGGGREGEGRREGGREGGKEGGKEGGREEWERE